MKRPLHFLSLFLLGLVVSVATAEAKKVAGPNGGRLLTLVEPTAEFFVTPERKVQITFVDDQLQTIPVADQTVVVTAGNRSAPTTLNFVRHGDVLLSDRALPPGMNFPAIVQLKTTPAAKPAIARFNVNFSTCSGCSYTEYACICDH